MSKSVSNFLLKRRSVTAKTMLASDVTNEDLDIIISSGLRVPDHGALSPWKIIVFKGKSREAFGKLFLGKRFKELNPSASKDDVIYEATFICSCMPKHTIVCTITGLCCPVDYRMVFLR